MFSFKHFRCKSEVTVDKIKHIFRQMSLFINVFRFWITNSFWDLVRIKKTLKNKAYWDICDTSPEVECFFQILFVILLTKNIIYMNYNKKIKNPIFGVLLWQPEVRRNQTKQFKHIYKHRTTLPQRLVV